MEPLVPSLPLPLTLPVCAGALALVLLQVWRLWDLQVAFVLLAVWLRYSIAIFHEYTYPPVLLGFSIVALTSIGVVAIGLLVVRSRMLLMRKLVPIYTLMVIVLVSAAANQEWVGAANEIAKWLYLTVLALATYEAMSRYGSERILSAFVVVFAAPITLQWISFAAGFHSTNEDGSPNFIGGYSHEQAFSIIIMTFLVVTCLSWRTSMTSAYIRLAIAAAGLVLANYRTTLLAATVPAAAFAVDRLLGKFVRKHRSVALVFLAAVTVVAFVTIANLAQERFVDVGATLHKGTSLIQPSIYFTSDELRLFSGRVHVWALYLEAYLRSDIVHWLIGFGPESWVTKFPLYAHNTFISYTYELGLFGLIVLIWILLSNAVIAAQVRGEGKLVLLACHFGFFVLNLATMPLWTIEGDILYAILLAYTWYQLSLQPATRSSSSARAGPSTAVYGVRRTSAGLVHGGRAAGDPDWRAT